MAFPASWSDWTSSSEWDSRPVPLAQRGGDVYFIIHHAVNTRVQDTIALSKPGGRQVSMTWAIGPAYSGVTSPVYCVAIVPEEYRPFTTASSLDGAAVTVEVSNIDLSATYPVAQEAKEWCAQIAAYMHVTYGMPLNRTYILSHQEVYSRGYGSYATACPGPDLQSSLDWIVNRAIQIVNGGSASGKKKTVTTLYHTRFTAGAPKANVVQLCKELGWPLDPNNGILYSLCGDSVGTPANTLLSQDPNLAQGLAGAHGSSVELSADTFVGWVRAYGAPVRIGGDIEVGDITVPSDPEVVKALKSIDAGVRAGRTIAPVTA